MLAPVSALLFAAVVLASPVVQVRNVTALNIAAFDEAQQRDHTATRAFASTEIRTSDGQCLFVDELSGDFRANLTPVQVAACDESAGQSWDIITTGKHDDQAGTMLVTQACLNFDPRRAAGNTVILFSCGGRGDGGGIVTNSQLFTFTGGAGPLSLEPLNQAGTCLAVTSANVLDEASCAPGDARQSFTFGGATSATVSARATPADDSSCSIAVETVTRHATTAAEIPAVTSAVVEADANPTTPVAVSRAGGVLQPSAAAESNPRDNTATRAFSSVSIKDSAGQCLYIDPTAGDFRQNLIPVQVQDCTGRAGEKFDFITAGIHNNEPNSTLVVSSLTQGCLNFDPRRAAGDTVILFSCGGRADGGGAVTDSQLFTCTAGETLLTLAPENQQGATCLVPLNGKLDEANCASGDASQLYTIVA